LQKFLKFFKVHFDLITVTGLLVADSSMEPTTPKKKICLSLSKRLTEREQVQQQQQPTKVIPIDIELVANDLDAEVDSDPLLDTSFSQMMKTKDSVVAAPCVPPPVVKPSATSGCETRVVDLHSMTDEEFLAYYHKEHYSKPLPKHQQRKPRVVKKAGVATKKKGVQTRKKTQQPIKKPLPLGKAKALSKAGNKTTTTTTSSKKAIVKNVKKQQQQQQPMRCSPPKQQVVTEQHEPIVVPIMHNIKVQVATPEKSDALYIMDQYSTRVEFDCPHCNKEVHAWLTSVN
jgi:hypothetical protein